MRVFQSQYPYSNEECLLIEVEGLLRLVPQALQARELMQRFRMLVSSLLSSNSQGALVERFRLLVVSLFSIQDCQPIERNGDLGMCASKRRLPEMQRALQE